MQVVRARTRGELPSEVVSLQHLRKKVEERREDLKEKLVKGHDPKVYHTMCGSIAELKWVIDQVNERLRSLDGGEDIDG